MTFKQFDINFNRFKYIVESNGVFVSQKRVLAAYKQFIPFEEVGSNIRRYRERKLAWLIVSLLFFLLAFCVFIERINGERVGDGAEAFWFVTGLILFVVYAFRRKNNLFLVKENTKNSIEFIGTKIYERRVNQFIEAMLAQRDIYLKTKYPAYDGLTMDENINCVRAGIQLHDGLLLKKLTKHPVQELRFGNGHTKAEKPLGICSMTTEKNARKITTSNQEKFINDGKYIFISEFSGKGYYIAIVGQTADPYQIMKYAGTSGANYDIDTTDIIAKFKKWDKAFGLKPVSIGSDFCEGEISNKNIDYGKLAAEVYEFCPDVVEQGTETVERLEKEIKETGRIFLWWD